MSDWIRIDYTCRHCGMYIEARYPPNPVGSTVIEGALPLEFRHINGEKRCIVRHDAEPYSIWDANKAWQREHNDD